MLHNSIQIEFLNIAVGTDNSENKTDVLAYICDVNEVLHADNTNAVIQIVDQAGILVDEYNASLALFRVFIREINHVLCFSTPFVSY